ncbi:MAG: hypothetical protein IJQ02_10020 [Oscillospiraceae bacterium]|nr:hypothetical protein [Oscillospiraceae bacterium]
MRVPEADEAELPLVRHDEAPAVERRDLRQRLPHGVLRRHGDLEAGGHQSRGAAVQRHAQDGGDLAHRVDVRRRPAQLGPGLAALGLEHRVIGPDGKQAVVVGLAGVDVVDSLGQPLADPAQVPDADIRADDGHAGDGGGARVDRELQLAGHSLTQGRGPGAEGGPCRAELRQGVHAVLRPGDVHLHLAPVVGSEDGLI